MADTLTKLAETAPEPYHKIKDVAGLLGLSYPTIQRRIKALNISLYTRGTNSRTKWISHADVDRIKEFGEEWHLLT